MVNTGFPSLVYIIDKKNSHYYFFQRFCATLDPDPEVIFPYLLQDRLKTPAKDLPNMKILGMICLNSAEKATHKA